MCVNHPHWRGERKCARCVRDFCAECLPDEQDLCDRCRQEEILADEIEARRRFTPRNILRWVTSGHTITSIVVFAFLLSIGLVPAFLTARSTAEEGIDPTVVRRVQVGLTQQVDLGDEGFDFIEIVNGGTAVSSGPAAGADHVLDRVHDGLFDPNFPAWRSGDASLPLVLTFAGRFRAPLVKAVIWNHPDEPSASYIRSFEIWTSLEDPSQNPDALTLAGRFTVAEPMDVARFEFAEPIVTRWVQVRILDTFGSADYVSAAEIGMFGPSRDPEPIPIPRSSGPVPI